MSGEIAVRSSVSPVSSEQFLTSVTDAGKAVAKFGIKSVKVLTKTVAAVVAGTAGAVLGASLGTMVGVGALVAGVVKLPFALLGALMLKKGSGEKNAVSVKKNEERKEKSVTKLKVSIALIVASPLLPIAGAMMGAAAGAGLVIYGLDGLTRLPSFSD